MEDSNLGNIFNSQQSIMQVAKGCVMCELISDKYLFFDLKLIEILDCQEIDSLFRRAAISSRLSFMCIFLVLDFMPWGFQKTN